MIILKKTKDESNLSDFSNIVFEIESNEISIDELIKELECFIKACGYSLKGNLEIVNEETQ